MAEAPSLSKWKRGEPMIWLTGSALGLCILMIVGLIGVILVNGLSFFWPQPLQLLTLKDQSVVLGDVVNREAIPNPGHPDHLKRHRLQLRVGNRDLYGIDFRWIDESEIVKREAPHAAYLVERREYGPLLGTPVLLKDAEREVVRGPEAVGEALPALIRKAAADRAAIQKIEKGEIGEINYRIERARLRTRKLDFERRQDPSRDQAAARAKIEKEIAEAQALYAEKQAALEGIVATAARSSVTFRSADGREKELRTLDIYRAYPANDLAWGARLAVYAGRLWEFFADDPRESNTEGGIFPAIFGTVSRARVREAQRIPPVPKVGVGRASGKKMRSMPPPTK